MSYTASTTKPGAATPVPESGVQRLNTDLANVFDRITNASCRVRDLADQFGTPDNPSAQPPEGPITTTNDHMSNIHRALSRLEQTISRIDNQG